MNAKEIRDEHIMDAFINGRHLFENKCLNLKTAYALAYEFEVAQKQSVFYLQSDMISAAFNTHLSHPPLSRFLLYEFFL